MYADRTARRHDCCSKRHAAASSFAAPPREKPASAFSGRAAGERKFADLAAGEPEADGTFCGYASLFGRADLGRDVVERGAFARSLKARGTGGIRMLFQHDPNEPIGAWTELREDARGLYVQGRLTAGVSRSREVLNLMRGAALDGLSIGFRTVKAKNDARAGVRRILEADLWEISVVTFPMMPGARIEKIEGSGRRPLPTAREFERWLTRDAGLTPGDARAVIARGYASLIGRQDAARNTPEGMIDMIRQATRMINGKDSSDE